MTIIDASTVEFGAGFAGPAWQWKIESVVFKRSCDATSEQLKVCYVGNQHARQVQVQTISQTQND